MTARSGLRVNPDLFFLINDGKLVVWNYADHRQYELSLEHLQVALSSDGPSDEGLVEELLEARVLVAESEAPATPWGWDKLSRIYHEGTSVTLSPKLHAETLSDPKAAQESYMEYCRSLNATTPPDAFSLRRGTKSVSLAGRQGPPEMKGLLETLQRRITSRNFGGTPIELDELALVVSETFRYREHDREAQLDRKLKTDAFRRSSPSGGSLQSCEAYVLSYAVNGLERGVYHYWSDHDHLGRIADLPVDPRLYQLLGAQAAADELSAAIIITCRFDKLWWKYPASRALRVALMDAGHLSQTAQLVATALGLRTWPTGYFFDPQVRECLGLTNSSEYPLLVVGLGDKGKPAPFDRYSYGDKEEKAP